MRRGSTWELDAQTGRIVSSYYGHRYELHVDEINRKRRRQMFQQAARERAEAEAGSTAAGREPAQGEE